MFRFICLFFPPLVALALHRKYCRRDNPQPLIVVYCLYTLAVNFFMCIMLAKYFPGTAEYIVSLNWDFRAGFAIKYAGLASFVSAGTFAAYFFVRSHIGFVRSHIGFVVTTVAFPERPRIWPYTVAALILAFPALAMRWILATFGNVTLDQLDFQLRVPQEGVNTDFVFSAVLWCVAPLVVLAALFSLVWLIFKKKNIYPYPMLRSNRHPKLKIKFHYRTFLALFSLGCATYACISILNLKIGEFITFRNTESSFIEENYVDPRSVNITFPEEKRNLIYIFMESMETTYMSTEQGGSMETSLIPGLYKLAQENVSFSSDSAQRGFRQYSNASWTIAAMTSQHLGVPLKLPVEGNSYNLYSSFLPEATGLGDILAAEGYAQALMVGSNADFGGRKNMYEQHGGYEIFDIFTARETGIVPPDYMVWWGFEDEYLYKYAKQEITRLSEGDQPFNFTMLTVDTHHVSGYVCALCESEFGYQMENVISCADRQIIGFIDWLKEQDFYENTTVVVAGDHLSMDPNLFKAYGIESKNRYIYNAFVNSSVTSDNTKNREMSSFDMLPSTLAAMGVTIDGDRLALGTNMFSNTPTLAEQFSYDYFDTELLKYSLFYDSLLNPK